MALALMLSAARNVTLGDRLMRDPARPPTALPCPMGTAVSGQTLGILGMGRIGEASEP
jgi:lactate dehydrogenase-like 2-hydroxyacid dehydrogenase